MASIFDDYEPLDFKTKDEEVPVQKRGKKRESLTPAEIGRGRKRLADMVERAFQTLEEATRDADYNIAVKAAQIILDRAGFGPKSSLDVTTTSVDLSNLSREELAERATRIATMLKDQKPVTIN